MLNTQTIANTFLVLGSDENIQITPMKLQKLTYFLYKEYLQRTDSQLFSEPFEKWKYGPVVPSLYYEFSSFGASPITRFAKNARGGVEVIDMNIDNDVTRAVRTVWKKYRNYSATELSHLTHRENTAWDKAKGYKLLDEDIKREEDLQ